MQAANPSGQKWHYDWMALIESEWQFVERIPVVGSLHETKMPCFSPSLPPNLCPPVESDKFKLPEQMGLLIRHLQNIVARELHNIDLNAALSLGWGWGRGRFKVVTAVYCGGDNEVWHRTNIRIIIILQGFGSPDPWFRNQYHLNLFGLRNATIDSLDAQCPLSISVSPAPPIPRLWRKGEVLSDGINGTVREAAYWGGAPT
ncbi:hypothetical protein QBC46DRAFT_412937 [Diplogelasinospora grovesii]|uniref:Uncharacterized protein n=1 Tax=Diplogelasinospora grovesii TaxID=303347 RepID=A0AAN6MXW3_9PEZI|nr:hypothetical protein QBC46DRAFT_412937 [Diplogelasinospora grovesii]